MIWPLLSRDVSSLNLQRLTVDHAQALADCHAGLFSRPWTDGEFYDLLSRTNVYGCGLVSQHGGRAAIAGFILAQCAADEAEILTVGVDPAWQKRGAGSQLVDAMLRQAYNEGISSVFLEVDEANAGAIALYRKHGFMQVASRQGYYGSANESRRTALVMRRDVR